MSPSGSSTPAASEAAPSLDPGSFRDWDSRVFYTDGRVLRALSPAGLDDWEAVAASRFFAEAVASGKVVETREVDDVPLPVELAETVAVL